MRDLRGVLPVPVRLPAGQRHEDAGRLHFDVRPGLRPHVRPVGQHQDRVHLPGRHLRTLAAQHAPVRGRGCRRRDTAGHHGRLRAGEVPFPGPQGRVRGHHRRDQRAGHRVGGPAVPAVRQAQPDEHAVGHDHSIVDQPVWFVSDVDLLRAGGSDGIA